MKIAKIKLRHKLYIDPFGVDVEPTQKRWDIPGRGFQPGNKAAARECMSEESHARRVAGLLKTYSVKYKREKGIKTPNRWVKKRMSKGKKREIRERLRETVAKEARDIQEIARKNAVAAMDVAKEIMQKGLRDSDRLAAANLVLERAYGKATQTNVNANVDANGTPKDVSAQELDQRIKKALGRVEELTGRATEPPPRESRPPNVRLRYRNSGGTSVH